MSQYVQIEERGAVTIARILWEKVSARETETLQPEILASLQSPTRLVVDLSAVALLASAGLGMLITLHKKAQENGGKMFVTGISPAILDVMKMTHLHKLLKIEDSFEMAVKKAAS
jgi:anti-sigma B factor antagonist